ncbi:hypothetical protein K4F52_006571 [Lecanicillium sp. MT-2017a]|nr:hypothetical protein K4F52_006571 [Lecanicillium sp. MT-2017a]
MYADITKPPAHPPLREVTIISLGILLLQPLSRRGSGPGLILVTENSENILKIADGVPSVFMKWAEEGYAVVQISVADLQTGRRLGDAVAEAATTLERLQFLKPKLNGPFFDLEKIWEEHTYYEFADRSVEHTMSTMVQEPYVNHIPTLTGGIGQHKLSAFYRHNFIFNNSQDTDLDLVSRTIGIDRVVDEFIFSFTHDREIDWLLPGVPPTHRKAHVPFTAVVNIRGDRLYHEHISWDQGTLLRQLGLMPEYLPFPYPVENNNDSSGGALEYRVPVAGVETANKVLDRHAVPSNEMFSFKPRARE